MEYLFGTWLLLPLHPRETERAMGHGLSYIYDYVWSPLSILYSRGGPRKSESHYTAINMC